MFLIHLASMLITESHPTFDTLDNIRHIIAKIEYTPPRFVMGIIFLPLSQRIHDIDQNGSE